MADSNDQRQIKKAQENEAAKEATGVAAKGAIDYFTGGTGGAVYDQAKNVPVVGKKLDKEEEKLGKTINKATGGKFGKAAKKAKDTGLLDAANMATSLGSGGAGAAGKGAGAAGAAGKGAGAAQQAGGPSSHNNGRALLNNMRGNAKPKDDEAEKKKRRLNRAIQIAKHIPIPQVKAAAEVADKANKLGAGNALSGGNKNKDNGEKSGSFSASGFFNKKKLILIGIISFGFIILLSALVSAAGSESSGTGSAVNDGVCVVDYVQQQNKEKCDDSSKTAKEFYKRVKDVKSDYSEQGKKVKPLYIAGAYYVISTRKNEIYAYKYLTTAKIKQLADYMFDEKDGEYTFNEETYEKNLREKFFPEVFPKATAEENRKMAREVINYVKNFEQMYGVEEEDDEDAEGSGSAQRLVQVAKDQLKSSNPDRFNDTNNKYQRYMGIVGQHWCAAFVSWCANEAGIARSIIPHSAAVDNFYSYYAVQKHGKFHSLSSGYTPKPGDLIIWKDGQNPKGWSHIGIVEKVQGGKLYTIEGNSGDKVSRNIWNSVAATGCTGFATPAYPKGSATKLKGSTYAQKTWNFFRDKGVSKETTAGIMGNLQQESGINPKSRQANGPGRGIAQWSVGGRFNTLVNRAKKAHKSWEDLGVQLDFLWYELNGGEATTKSVLNNRFGGFKHFIKNHDVDWAVRAFEQSFERAGKPNYPNRYKYAHDFYNKYGKK